VFGIIQYFIQKEKAGQKPPYLRNQNPSTTFYFYTSKCRSILSKKKSGSVDYFNT